MKAKRQKHYLDILLLKQTVFIVFGLTFLPLSYEFAQGMEQEPSVSIETKTTSQSSLSSGSVSLSPPAAEVTPEEKLKQVQKEALIQKLWGLYAGHHLDDKISITIEGMKVAFDDCQVIMQKDVDDRIRKYKAEGRIKKGDIEQENLERKKRERRFWIEFENEQGIREIDTREEVEERLKDLFYQQHQVMNLTDLNAKLEYCQTKTSSPEKGSIIELKRKQGKKRNDQISKKETK